VAIALMNAAIEVRAPAAVAKLGAAKTVSRGPAVAHES